MIESRGTKCSRQLSKEMEMETWAVHGSWKYNRIDNVSDVGLPAAERKKRAVMFCSHTFRGE